jgi:hypothetical protein
VSERKLPTEEGYWYGKYCGCTPEVFEVVMTRSGKKNHHKFIHDGRRLAVRDKGELPSDWDDVSDDGYEWICQIPEPATLAKLTDLDDTLKLFAEDGISTVCDRGELSFEKWWKDSDDDSQMVATLVIDIGGFKLTRFRNGKVLDIGTDIAKEMQAVYEVKLAAQAEELRILRAEHSDLMVAVLGMLRPHLDDCRLDHHGYCQSHGMDKPCEVDVARKTITAIAARKAGK